MFDRKTYKDTNFYVFVIIRMKEIIMPAGCKKKKKK